MVPKCIWTNKRSDRLKKIEVEIVGRFGTGRQKETVYVLEEHEEQVRKFIASENRNGLRFVLAMVTISVAMTIAGVLIGTGVLKSFVALAVLITLLGIVIVIYPFVAPETVKLLGLRRSILLARISGVITILIGIALPFVLPLLEG